MKKCLIPNAVCHHPAPLLGVLFPYQVAEELLSLLRRAPSPSFGRRAVPQLDCTGHATKSIHTSCSPFLFSPTPDTSPVFCHLSKTVFIMEISNYILGDVQGPTPTLQMYSQTTAQQWAVPKEAVFHPVLPAEQWCWEP